MPEKDCSCAPRESTPSAAGPSLDRPLGEQENRDDFVVLSILLHPEDHDGLWSIQELKCARRDPLSTEDSIARLVRAGLIHQHGEFVFPTRAATRYSELTW